MPERWLLTGGTGQVGLALRRIAPAGVEIVAPGRTQLDLADPQDVGSWLHGVSAVINCAAYTAVDQAECEPEQAMQVNATAPGILARAAAQTGIPLVHVSTDYVFPVDGTGPWREHDRALPGNTYGESKFAGEQAVRASGARHAIIRTAWVVSADGTNFVKTMLRLGAEREVLRVVADQRGTPTHAGDLASALVTIARRFTGNPDQPSGTWHCTNAGETTWHGLATRIFARAEELGLKVPEVVEPIRTADYPTRAVRPQDSRLDCSLIARDFGIALRSWEEAVSDIVGELASEGLAA